METTFLYADLNRVSHATCRGVAFLSHRRDTAVHLAASDPNDEYASAMANVA